MRKSVLALIVLSLLAGCEDKQARQNAQMRQQFEQALAKFQEAQTGFITGKAADGKDADPAKFQAQRLELLNQAAAELRPLWEKGTPSQRAAAARILADIHADKARQASQQAVSNWVAMSSQGVQLTHGLVALNQAQSRQRSLNIDESPLVSQLEAETARFAKELEDLTQKIYTLTQQTQKDQAKIDELIKQRQELSGQAMDVKGRAFTVKGQARLDMENQAADLQRQSEAASRDAETLQARLAVTGGELVILKKQQELTQVALQTFAQQQTATKERQDVTQKSLAQAQQQTQASAQDLIKTFEEFHSQYGAQVESLMEQAVSASNQAVGTLSRAQQLAPVGPERQGVESDLLQKRVLQAHVLVQQGIVATSYLSSVNMLATGATGQDVAKELTSRKETALTKRNDALHSARQAVEAAQELATKLSSASGSLGVFAQQQDRVLQDYSKQLEDLSAARG